MLPPPFALMVVDGPSVCRVSDTKSRTEERIARWILAGRKPMTRGGGGVNCGAAQIVF